MAIFPKNSQRKTFQKGGLDIDRTAFLRWSEIKEISGMALNFFAVSWFSEINAAIQRYSPFFPNKQD